MYCLWNIPLAMTCLPRSEDDKTLHEINKICYDML